MANPEHLAKLKEGVESWNLWRQQNPGIEPDLREANLSGANLMRANLHGANLHCANLSGADLRSANLSRADLTRARLVRADLRGVGLSRAFLAGANLRGADLRLARLRQTDLRGADLNSAILVQADLEGANLTSCSVYGISAWNVNLKDATQSNLVITREGESKIEVDNLEVAQFIYLLLNNAKIRDVIDTITSKVVLILGRFTPERKAVLDGVREGLRNRNYLPVLMFFCECGQHKVRHSQVRDFRVTASTSAP